MSLGRSCRRCHERRSRRIVNFLRRLQMLRSRRSPGRRLMSRLPKITGQSPESRLKEVRRKVHGSPVGPSLETKGLRFRPQGLESGTSGKTSASDILLLWLISASTRICAQSSREVHRASTSDGIPRRTTESLHPRRIAQKKTKVTVYIELLRACARKRKVA